MQELLMIEVLIKKNYGSKLNFGLIFGHHRPPFFKDFAMGWDSCLISRLTLVVCFVINAD